MNYGRNVIYSDEAVITRDNVRKVVEEAYNKHTANNVAADILYDYYKGKTKILNKSKEFRTDINHMINENRAFEIVDFHKGYTFGEPVQYVRRENAGQSVDDDSIAAEINRLNGFMLDAHKSSRDNELAEWMYVCGTSYRLALPNADYNKDIDELPFVISTLDPRYTFVVYDNTIGKNPLCAVTYITREDNEILFCVYTDKAYYEFSKFGSDVEEIPHMLNMIPIIEYPANPPRLGVFEVALPLLDALDELQSNRMDDVVQTVNSILTILGGELPEEAHKNLKDVGLLNLPDGVDAKYLNAPLSQTDIQTLKDDLYQSILTICGVPNRSGGSTAGDNGVAVIYRDGYATAETRSKAVELMFKESETKFLKLILGILRTSVGTTLKLSDIDTHFTRRNYENIAAKSQVLIAMLNSPKIHPELAFASCGMFPDPESAYLQSKAYYEEQMEKWKPVEVDENVPNIG